MMMGGLSIITAVMCFVCTDRGASITTVAEFAALLAFVCNNPHFLASYGLLYRDYRADIFRKRAYFWAAVLAPALIAVPIALAWYRQNGTLMGHVVSAMFFFVGWHYVKQIFGCVIVTSVQRGIYYSLYQKNLILFNLFMTWAMSWIQSHLGGPNGEFYGVRYTNLGLAPWSLYVVYALAGISGALVVREHVKIYVERGQKPSPPAVAAWLSIYIWYLPVAYHPQYGYLIPFFHSLQYLAFIWHLKSGEIRGQIRELKEREWRAAWLRKIAYYSAGVVVTGAFAFEIIPRLLDSAGWLPRGGALGSEPFMVGILLFINIHHYFIDNVIWKSDNPKLKTYLFKTDIAAVPDKALSAS